MIRCCFALFHPLPLCHSIYSFLFACSLSFFVIFGFVFYAFLSLCVFAAVSYHTFIHCDCCNVTFNDKKAVWERRWHRQRLRQRQRYRCVSFFALSLSPSLGLHLCTLAHFMRATAIIGLIFSLLLLQFARSLFFHSLCTLSPPNVYIFADLFDKSYDI